MLARNFKSADELGLTDRQLEALIKVLDKLERGELREIDVGGGLFFGLARPEDFSMNSWNTCLCAHAYRVNGSIRPFDAGLPRALRTLFMQGSYSMERATNALRDFLVTGYAD